MSETQAARMNEGKPELDFILDYFTALESFCRVMELGAAKYERDNWKLGGKPDAEYLAAAMRHMKAHRKGEMFAEDSGCLHIAHAAWNLFAILELNMGGVTHDPELFAKMKAHWLAVKAKKAKPPVAGVDYPIDVEVEFTYEQKVEEALNRR